MGDPPSPREKEDGMSRSGYSDDCENLGLWRGTVERAIRGKRGQALLKELEAALVAMPEKKLCSESFAIAATGEVCALGAVALKRRLDAGMDKATALADIEKKYPEYEQAEAACKEFDIAGALAKEITYINDEYYSRHANQEQRYENVLKWVRENIKKEGA